MTLCEVVQYILDPRETTIHMVTKDTLELLMVLLLGNISTKISRMRLHQKELHFMPDEWNSLQLMK